RFMQMFEMKPAFASSFASALCLLLLFGIVYAEQSDQTTPQASLFPSTAMSSESLVPNQVALNSMSQPPAPNVNVFADSISNSAPSSLQPLFGSSGNVFAQQASFNFS